MAAPPYRSSVKEVLGVHKASRTCRLQIQHLLVARSQRSSRLTCDALAMPQGLQWPFREAVDRCLKRRHQPLHGASTISVEAKEAAEALNGPLLIKHALLEATSSAIQVGLSLTGIALRLAKRVVDEMRRSIALIRPLSQNSSAASDLMRNAQAQLIQKAKRETLEERGRDMAFMQMLHNLDRCHMNHEEKWALFKKHSADKAEFSERWQHLYKLAKESKTSVDTLLRPDASRTEINQFWRSAETSAIIAEENALKQLVFAQVFTAGRST